MARPYKLRTIGDFSVIVEYNYYNVCFRDGRVILSHMSRATAYTERNKCQYYYNIFCSRGIC